PAGNRPAFVWLHGQRSRISDEFRDLPACPARKWIDGVAGMEELFAGWRTCFAADLPSAAGLAGSLVAFGRHCLVRRHLLRRSVAWIRRPNQLVRGSGVDLGFGSD